jgi:hypothetical protein
MKPTQLGMPPLAPTQFGTATRLFLIGCLALCSCVSKGKADAKANAAFVAGQRQAAMMALQSQIRGPSITVIGEVRNPLVPWTIDLTLTKAVLAAEYYGKNDPSDIVIRRNGQEARYNAKQLLDGTDVQLQPGDVIELRP